MKIFISISKIPEKFKENTWYVGNLEQDYQGKPKGSNVGWLIRYMPNKVTVTILFDGKDWFEYLYSNETDTTKIMKPFRNKDGAWVTIRPDVARTMDVELQRLTNNSAKLKVQR